MNKRKLSDVSNAVDSESNSFKIKKIGTDSTPEDGFINYTTALPSLESIALGNIIVKLWSHTDFGETILRDGLKPIFCNYPDKDGFNELSKIISEKLSLLSLPKILKYKAECMVKSIGLEIVHWIKDFEYGYWHSNSEMIYFRSICWTMKGTIDKVKTLELHFDHENILHIYNKACEYCLEDRIDNLWKQIPKETQESYFYCKSMYKGYNHHLIAYWTCFAKNELPTLLSMIEPSDYRNIYNYNHSICMNMFKLSVFEGKMLAVKYFWNKLTDEERNNNKVNWTYLAIERKKKNSHNNEYTDIMCFLLSQMNDKEQQREVFQKHSDIILNSLFFSWPWQTFLLPTMELIWDFIDGKIYIQLLLEAINRIGENKLIGMVLKDLWCNSPMNLKKDFINLIIDKKSSEVVHLLEIGGIETVKLLLKDANVEEKKKIVFATVKSEKLLNLMYANKLFLLETLMRESMMLECEIKNVKEDILLKHGEKLCYYCIYNDNWQTAEKNLDWCFYSEDQVATFKAKILNRIKVDNALGILGAGKWSSFEIFINWLFNSDEEICQFKLDRLIYHKMKYFIYDIIMRGYNFEFANKLLDWYFPSITEIDQFKKELMISDVGLDMFHKVLSNHVYRYNNYGFWNLVDYEREDHIKYNRYVFVKQLTEWFCPFNKESIIGFKEKFTQNFLRYEQFPNRFRKLKIQKIQNDLFPLLDCFTRGSDDDNGDK